MTAVPQTKALRFTGLDDAPMIPASARVVAAYWVLAEDHGPGHDRGSEAEAIRAGIARYHERKARRSAFEEAWAPMPEAFSVDLRWKMQWEQGATTDAHGRLTTSSGIDFTVRRTHYESIAEAQAHLDRIEKYAEPEDPEPMPVGAMLDTILRSLGADAKVTVSTAAHETVFDLYTSGHALRAKTALVASLGDPYDVVMRSNLVQIHRRTRV